LHAAAEQAAVSYAIVGNSPRFIFRWIAGHSEVRGNEVADQEAKKAALEGSSPREKLPPALRHRLPANVDAIRSSQLDMLRDEWKDQWRKSPRKGRMDAIDDSFPFDRHRKISEALTRAQASLLTQLRTRHIPLNMYLHKIGKSPTDRCDACWRRHQCETRETIQHFLFECPEYNLERSRLQHELGRDSRDLRSILKDKKKTRELLHYIGRTRRLHSTLGNLKLHEN
jgi:hypothetical protein